MDDNMQAEAIQYMYMVHHSDITGIQKHSGIFSDINKAFALLVSWKSESDAIHVRFITKYGGDDSDYDVFSLTAFPTDGTEGKTMYSVQGNNDIVNLLFTPPDVEEVEEVEEVEVEAVMEVPDGDSEAGDIQDDL